MQKLIAEGYCGKQHTLDKLEACEDCKKYRETWNEAIEAAAKEAVGIRLVGVHFVADQIRKLKK